MKVRLWGVRGSIPSPGPDTVKYGGNTSCIELRFGEKRRLIIIDAGSGLRVLSDHLMTHDIKNGPIEADLFLTHTHWDHILGFPFFVPIYIPGTKLRIWGPPTHEEESLDKVMAYQLSYRYFPVRHEELAAKIEYHNIQEGRYDLGDGIIMKTKLLNHPILVLGYRFEYHGRTFCTCYDHEPFYNLFPTDPKHPDYDPYSAEEGEAAAREENERVAKFFYGADVLLHDAQYTIEEYRASKIGWGHSAYEHAINAAHRARVKKLVLFHHDINRTDAEIDRFEEHYRGLISGKSEMQVEMAREGMEFDLS